MTFELPPNDPSGSETERPGRLSQNGQMIAIGVYGGLLVTGFFFGIVAGYEPAKPVAVVAKAARERDTPKAETPKLETPKVSPKSEPQPQPVPTPVAVPKDEPKPEPPKVDPPKQEEPKKPEPKKEEPRKEEVAVKPASFQKDVLPILRSYCFNCHGGAGKPKGDVDLTSLAKITDPKNPPILTAGKPEKSAIYTTVADMTMPPEGSRPGKGETEVIRNWILGGAKPRRRYPNGRPPASGPR